MAAENSDKTLLVDLMEALRSQHKVISFLVATDHALVETLANEPALANFVASFQNRYEYALKHPGGPLAQALRELQDTLDAIVQKVKADIGDWEN